mmetsp:Transcript_9447/g.24494  ORF Transcript_9447/g.24494 Transcript_9447/m.24494 type:complete len:447 (+) Transcript_9447:663-2003(+)
MGKLAIPRAASVAEEVVAELGLGQVRHRHQLSLRVREGAVRAPLASVLAEEHARLRLVELCIEALGEHGVHGIHRPLRRYGVCVNHRLRGDLVPHERQEQGALCLALHEVLLRHVFNVHVVYHDHLVAQAHPDAGRPAVRLHAVDVHPLRRQRRWPEAQALHADLRCDCVARGALQTALHPELLRVVEALDVGPSDCALEVALMDNPAEEVDECGVDEVDERVALVGLALLLHRRVDKVVGASEPPDLHQRRQAIGVEVGRDSIDANGSGWLAIRRRHGRHHPEALAHRHGAHGGHALVISIRHVLIHDALRVPQATLLLQVRGGGGRHQRLLRRREAVPERCCDRVLVHVGVPAGSPKAYAGGGGLGGLVALAALVTALLAICAPADSHALTWPALRAVSFYVHDVAGAIGLRGGGVFGGLCAARGLMLGIRAFDWRGGAAVGGD